MSKTLKIALAISALIVFGACGAGKTSNTGSSTDNSGSGDKPAAVGIGQPARDGKFEFVVSKLECGISKIGDQYLNRTAQGQFCKVSMSVKNIGNEAKLFTDSNQHAYNAAGQKYEADSAAAIYLGQDSKSFLENINPGNAVNGVIIFDIPKDGKIVKLELHDSAFSGGVTVNV
jgi:hypothetical protein